MATKKAAAPAKKVTVKAKPAEVISKDFLTLQTKLRDSIMNLSAEFLDKYREIEDLDLAIQDKKSILGELGEAESISEALKDLQEKYKDAEHEHKRSLAILKTEFDDNAKALQRELLEQEEEALNQRKREERSRLLKYEDEDRQEALKREEQQRVLAQQASELAKKEEELGDFDAAVERKSRAIIAQVKQNADFETHKLKTEYEARLQIMQAEVLSLKNQNSELLQRLERAEDAANRASDRAQAIAVASLDKESGKAALDELRGVAHRQAESGKR